MKHIIALGALALLAVPVSMAASVVSTHDITSQLPPEAQPIAQAPGSYYLADDGSIWMESNGVAGLQQAAFTDAAGRHHDADTLVQGAPGMPALPGAPALPSIPL